MLRSNASASSATPAFLICDRAFIKDFGIGLVHPGTKDLTEFLQTNYLIEARNDRRAGTENPYRSRSAC